MGEDHKSSTASKIELPDFPGEQVLAHEGNAWIIAATVKLAPHELIVVAETGVPPAARAIVDTDLSDYPELPANHPQYERRKSERKKFITQNEANVEQRARVTLRAWTTLFESLRSCCVSKASLLSFELYEVCALDRQGVSGGYFDGPLAWRILLERIEGDGERSEQDKKFYSTALKWQDGNKLANGASQQEYQKRAFAFVQYIMPNLAQKFEANDASEYILALMPEELYEAGQRVKFSAKMVGRFLDHKYLIRLCGEEVFKKQKASGPQPTFIAFDTLGGHPLELMAMAVGVEGLQTASGDHGVSRGGPPHPAFAGVGKTWCPKCPHNNNSCICDPYNTKSPPPSVYLNTNRWKELMSLRDRNGAGESPPFTPKPVPKPSAESIKKYQDIMAKRNNSRRGDKKDKDKKATPEGAATGGVAANTDSLESFFEGLRDVTDESDIPGAAGLVSADGPPASESATTPWCCIVGAGDVDGVHKSATISDEQWNTIIEGGGSIYEFDTEAAAIDSLAVLVDAAGDDAATADDARTHVSAAPPGPETPFDCDAARLRRARRRRLGSARRRRPPRPVTQRPASVSGRRRFHLASQVLARNQGPRTAHTCRRLRRRERGRRAGCVAPCCRPRRSRPARRVVRPTGPRLASRPARRPAPVPPASDWGGYAHRSPGKCAHRSTSCPRQSRMLPPPRRQSSASA